MRKTTLSFAALLVAVALLAIVPIASAGKPAPSLTLSSVTVDGPATGGYIGCTSTLNWSVNGLKGSPKQQWTVHAEARHRFNGGTPDAIVDTVTVADNGVAQTTVMNGFIGTTETWTVRIWLVDSKGKTLVTSSPSVVSDIDCVQV